MANIVSFSDIFTGDGNPITIQNPSSPGRAIVVVGSQSRTPVNLANFVIDGVSARSENIRIQDTSAGTRRAIVAVFENSDLPVDSGSYTVSKTPGGSGLSYMVFELSDYSDQEFVSNTTDANTQSQSPTVIDFPSAAPGDLFLFAYRQSENSAASFEVLGGVVYSEDSAFIAYGSKINSDNADEVVISNTSTNADQTWVGIRLAGSASTPALRKTGQQTFDKPAGIGTITGVTLNGETITLDSQDAETFTVTDSDGSITTSGEYDLVATGDTVETITVQVNVVGVAPANNPLQKDGAPLANLTDVEVRISAGATLAGTQLFYTGTATTDASGNLGNIDLSDTAADPDDVVLLKIRTAAGDSIIAAETVELI